MVPNNSPQTAPNPKVHHTPDQGRSHLSAHGKRLFQLIEFDSDEELLLEIRKHPFGLAILIVTGAFIATTIFAFSVVLAMSGVLQEVGLGSFNQVVVFIGFILAILAAVIVGVNAQLYNSNVVFVTNEKIAQVAYITLFHRKVSQLSIGDVQDVSVQQRGFLAHTFHYGTLVIETAGEQQNYSFTYVPKPHEASRVIINAHEENVKLYGN